MSVFDTVAVLIAGSVSNHSTRQNFRTYIQREMNTKCCTPGTSNYWH